MSAERDLNGQGLNPVGLGCMNLSHAYGVPPTPEIGRDVLHKALDLGVQHFDTAALYGFGANEILLGSALKSHRQQVFIASKCGMTGVDGKRVIDGRPETLKRTCDEALKRLQTDYIDLYYLHRWDKSVPIEESVGALADLVHAGKIRAIGLSEVSAQTLRSAHAVHPIKALQSEYSLWTRNPEIAVLEFCAEIGAALVAFSPLGRGFLAGGVQSPDFASGDVRIPMPRFVEPNRGHNLQTFQAFQALADKSGVTPAQLAVAWVLSRGDHVHVIPGTTSLAHLKENMTTGSVSPDVLKAAELLINRQTIQGARYPDSVQAEIDTEDF